MTSPVRSSSAWTPWIRRWSARLADEGRLPVLADLLRTWDAAPTRNPLGLVVGGLWPIFWSGIGPGHHGSYCFRQVVPGGGRPRDTRPTDIDTPPFWEALDREGYRCTVFDVPLLARRPLAHGRVIGDWGTHDRQLDFVVPSRQPREGRWPRSPALTRSTVGAATRSSSATGETS